MPILPAIAVRAAAKASTWAPMRNLLAGAAAYWVKHYNDQAAEPALEVWNTHASGTAPVFWARDSLNGDKLIEVLQSGVTLRSPDASQTLVVGNTGVIVNGESISGEDVASGVTVYNVLDHGLVTGATSTPAAANTAALQALWITVGTAGGGVIYFPPGTYPLNATTLNHTAGGAVSVSIMGTLSTILNFYGVTGPFLQLATAVGSELSRCSIKDIRLQHAATPTSGATLRLDKVTQFVLDGVKMPAASTSLASLICVQLTGTATVVLRDCKLETQQTGAVNPITIDVASTSAVGGVLYTYNTDLSGYPGASTGIRFANTGDIDTVILGPGTSIKDHNVSILKTSLAGNIENLIATGAIFDVTTTANIQIQPVASSDIGNVILTGCWFSSQTYNILIDETGGGTVAGVQIEGGYLTNAVTCAVLIGTGVDNVFLRGNRIGSSVSGAGDWVVDINGTNANVIVSDNLIAAGSSGAAGCLRIASTVTPVVVNGNLFRSGTDADGISFGGATSAARVNANNAYTA